MINVNKVYKSLFSLFSHLIVIIALLALTCPLYGQVMPKRYLTPAEYHLWENIHLDRVSPDEKWASYKVTSWHGNDTLVVRNIQNGLIYSFARGVRGTFTKENFFLCQIGDELILQNLKTGKRETILGMKEFTYCIETNQIIVLRGSEKQEKTLTIKSLSLDSSEEIASVTQFLLSPKGHHLLYETKRDNKSALVVLNLTKLQEKKQLMIANGIGFSSFKWQKDGYSVAFVSQSAERKINALFHYIFATNKLYKLEPASHSFFSDGLDIATGFFARIIISDDMQKVFFAVQNKASASSSNLTSDVEIWNGNDGFTYQQEKNYGNYNLRPKIALWVPDLNQLHQISSAELPGLMLTGNFEHAILSNPKAYEPTFEQLGSRDFYVMDLKTLKKDLVLKNHPYDHRYPNASPSGKYFVYFKGNDWWVYDILAKTHTNLTHKIKTSFIGKTEMLVPKSAYGNPGWSIADKEILLYDQYDLWAVTPDGKSFRRLTKGSELGIKYRIAPEPNKIGENAIYDGRLADIFDLSKDLFLIARGDDEKTGYYRWNAKTGAQPIVYGDSYVDELNYNGTKKKIFYREQKFDLSPRLMSADNSSGPIPFFKSNLQQQGYYWGKSELISYTNSKGVRLKGTLFYPANYDPKKKYPMVVYVYELQSSRLHRYENPVYEGASLNLTILTSQGYFVLLPDIQLLEGNPGISAADCTIAATKSVIEKGLVDSSKIGLIGHSFGGYETAFIITQSNLFATAIASGGITNLISFYHNYNPNTGVPDMWRFKDQQWNMGGTPYEIPELYNANSPIAHVQNVRTPVLLWTGKVDPQVNPNQTMEFYLALRRLGKKSIMLQYPKEGHILLNNEFKKDLTQRMMGWFDYFLKDEKPADWIANGTK